MSCSDRLSQADPSADELCARLGICIPSIVLPAPSVNLSRWAVIACDQYTAQPDYWKTVEQQVGPNPSSLHLVLPELYLEHPGDSPVATRIACINQNMQTYLDQEILIEQEPACMLVDRATPLHPSRKGLMLAIDLECYDYTPGNRQLIRATEGTVLERIPPRQAIRKDALLELPHIQLLMDDPGLTVIEPLYRALADGHEPAYHTTLMQGGGEVSGWFVTKQDPAMLAAIQALARLDSLLKHGLLFAVGDGNHSLATAKAHWHSIRSQAGPDHPARYALVEIINIHDQGIAFEPIHRVIFDVDPAVFMAEAKSWLQQHSRNRSRSEQDETCEIPVCLPEQDTVLTIRQESSRLVTGTIQAMLDDLIGPGKIFAQARLDYIHGDAVVRQLSRQGHVGLLLPALDKGRFFELIARDGVLPRKTFSMGESFEKRYYIECRKIR